MKNRYIIISVLLLLVMQAGAQVIDIRGKVFGGARQANVGGSTFVNIGADHHNVVINAVYGGSDISGTIGHADDVPVGLNRTLAASNGITATEGEDAGKNITRCSAFIRTNREAEGKHLFIGQLFGGGYGNYNYTEITEEGENKGKLRVTDKNTGAEKAAAVDNKPELDRTYLEICGGTIGYVYGGGDAVTVTGATDICIQNTSEVTTDAEEQGLKDVLTTARLGEMGLSTVYTKVGSSDYQFARVFGGNNMAEMNIRPTWHLREGKIRDLYSGGNAGAMTFARGIVLALKKETMTGDGMEIGNVYGGCRMADVNPGGNNTSISAEEIDGISYPAGYAARLYIGGGKIWNVYGGNDITGTVYGGNAVGIHTSILGDVYGGGNGSYPYTDNAGMIGNPRYGDYYYAPGNSSVDALNAFRPNAEQVSIRVQGESEDNPTVIDGALYCGGNSATIYSENTAAKAQLKIGSYVIADKVFLGNNGENMVSSDDPADTENNPEGNEGVLWQFRQTGVEGVSGQFNSMNLKDEDTFEKYMDGVTMRVIPNVVFDSKAVYNDPDDYQPYSTYIGEFYCGGNVGSIYKEGAYTIDFTHAVVIYNRLVGGSNNAYVKETEYNAAYNGGLLGTPGTTTGNKLVLNLSGLKIQPRRKKLATDPEPETYPKQLVWNTVGANGTPVPPVTSGEGEVEASTDDLARRFIWGNIYGGCCMSGHVNGNVVINIDDAIIDRDELFDEVESDELGEDVSLYGEDQTKETTYNIIRRHTGVILGQQGMDVLGSALNVFGGGYGPDSEIWGSTTINLNRGYAFQVFGGGEQGAIGKKDAEGKYVYDRKYSCYVNLRGENPGVSKKVSQTEAQEIKMAECEFMYGGGFFGTIAGNTYVNLGNGRIFNSFAGSCNADILGHTETYIGRQVRDASKNHLGTLTEGNEDSDYDNGFPYVRDYVYGGNDLGGEIRGTADMSRRVRNANVMKMVHGYDSEQPTVVPDVLKASAYVEYQQGRALGLFGGCYGTYDYKDRKYSDYTDENGEPIGDFKKPHLTNAFVNFRPLDKNTNSLDTIYGGAQGYPGEAFRDKMQNRSYVLIDVPENSSNNRFENLQVFGAGAWGGLGMVERVNPGTTGAAADAASAIIDLVGGSINAVYGASYKEGFTRRTVVNVPKGSTIKLNRIFGGGYGESNQTVCDVYESNVNYHSEQASVGTLYGGNNQYRRTLYGKVNVDVPAWSDRTKGYMASVYGAGRGVDTWSQYTEVNLLPNAQVYEVYGGGENGKVMNKATEVKWAAEGYTDNEGTHTYPLDMDGLYTENADDGLDNALAGSNALATDYPDTYGKFNTNVHIHKDALVLNYAFAGGKGTASNPAKGIEAIPHSGDVYGTTYIGLLGGTIKKDIYGAGSVGAVLDNYRGTLTDDFGKTFVAATHCYVRGGSARNAYGGGWQGNVGYTGMELTADSTAVVSGTMDNDTDAETHLVIGRRKDQASLPSDYGFYNGVPVVQRNAYGGGEGQLGEGGAVYGKTYLTLNNGAIGYEYDGETASPDGLPVGYREKLDDETWDQGDGTGRLRDYGNVFGGGYSDKSSVDNTEITIWGGVTRGSVYGGGEIATVGRGSTKEGGKVNSVRELRGIYKTGTTSVTMYNGHVLRNVFGGGKGYNVLGYGGEHELYTDGYVFGSTAVYIHGGEVGTEEGVKQSGYGNVFGGGDLGYVYGRGYNDVNSRKEETESPGHYYYYVTENGNKTLTEDCKVVVAPFLQMKAGSTPVTYGGETYGPYDYVPTDYLNTLPKDKEQWGHLYTGDNRYLKDANGETLKDENGNDRINPLDPEERGIHIRNAVFGGGNVSSNSDQTYANATTVFGNTTATLYDVYHRDFITVGTEHTGGLYGGGNLSVVDGYRELNITNYGTDYYGLKQTITIDEYRGLSNRERAYFQLEYRCTAEGGVTINNVTYPKDKILSEEEYLKLANNENTEIAQQAKDNFEPYGFCSIYAGRLLNTIQRADLCGVYGSRMVLQGAKDRVAEVGEDINYTINRVNELSLNKQKSVIASDQGNKEDEHGNYFGIYSIVNYLGNITSDVHFTDLKQYEQDDQRYYAYVNSDNKEVRTVQKEVDGVLKDVSVNTLTDAELEEAGLQKISYYDYKAANPTSSDRNKGSSLNQVALASGVFLELTTEKTETNANKEKDYGYITGVVELDLINVKNKLMGGGFVYAKNEHRVGTHHVEYGNVILSEYNKEKKVDGVELRDEARTFKRYVYEGGAEMVFETSGNFIHPDKRIVDDCYPVSNSYAMAASDRSVAHYWYVKGDVYVYEQKVSAYTGSANAYSKEVHLPLTITAASKGQLQLLNVKPNLYAYYMPGETEGSKVKIGSRNDTDGKPIDKVTVNNESDTYQLNDVVSWWDWYQMSPTDRQYFVPQTYLNCVSCRIGDTFYSAGTYVMDEKDFTTFKASHEAITDSLGETVKDRYGHEITVDADVVDYVFRPSNNISHDAGYVLTFDMDTPKKWDDYYTKIDDKDQKYTKEEYEAQLAGMSSDEARNEFIKAWPEGPTFTPVTSGVYGKRQYTEGEVVTKATYENAGTGQDKMKPAYMATQQVTYTYDNTTKTLNKGTAISETEYNALDAATKVTFAKALICTGTVKIGEGNYLFYGDLKTEAEITAIKQAVNADTGRPDAAKASLIKDIENAMTEAYICTETAEYGGQSFEVGKNYPAIQAWCSLPKDDRITTDGTYNFTYNYDALDLLTAPDYLQLANPNGTTKDDAAEMPLTTATVDAFHTPYTDLVDVEFKARFVGDNATESITYSVEYEKDGQTVTVTGKTVNKDSDPIDREEFDALRNDKQHYTYVKKEHPEDNFYVATTNFVYLGTPYAKGKVVEEDVYQANTGSVEKVNGSEDTDKEFYYCYEEYTDENGNTVQKGTRIGETDYKNLTNLQKYFVIQGLEPTERTTLYVSRESDILDVMKEKVITVVYQYSYYDEDDSGDVEMTNELHVVNILLELKSGAPQIGLLSPPAVVLPGQAVGLKNPDVNPGLYEVMTNGWEIYDNEQDAMLHRNPTEFTNGKTPVYWYQNQQSYVVFYSQTWMGRTYSNPVPVSVANYHDIADVMAAKDHHMYIDRDDVNRACKIYINDYSGLPDSDPRYGMNGLDELKNLFDLSTGSTLEGHTALGSHIEGCKNLEFYLHADIERSGGDWTPIAPSTGTHCFAGNLHGDGHTVSGLTGSLFGSLCGNVYNLGVTGSFTSAGVADTGTGYVENCWVKSSAISGFPADTNPVFGHPTDGTGTQLVNCYYSDKNPYQTKDYGRGMARKMADKAFYNGEVAYNLNGFYLSKRYYDNNTIWEGTKKPYHYLDANAGTEGALPADSALAYYPQAYAFYPLDETQEQVRGYVEERFCDGDYRYAGGTIPETADIRMRTRTETVTVDGETQTRTYTNYYPIWPDDYLFFGQRLNYDHVGNYAHQDQPSAIIRANDRLLTTQEGNRVYRAPAYYRSKQMTVAHFNPYAVFAKTKNGDASVVAYKNLTAIDFTGGNGDVSGGYKEGLVAVEGAAEKAFYPPLLDDDGLTGFHNEDLSQNLLVYTEAPGTDTAGGKTGTVVGGYLDEPDFEEDGTDYRRVAYRNPSSIRGHWVEKQADGTYMVTDRDHLLVDKQDFNCPIAYRFTDGTGDTEPHRMWYQRDPELFAGQVKNNENSMDFNPQAGWEGISLPFTASLVTTQQKGELTHFYRYATDPDKGRMGHEYWLREFTSVGATEGDATTVTAGFTYPEAKDGDEDKEVGNTFLWDYYYKGADEGGHLQKDLNADTYQTYYNSARTYPDYPLLAKGTPYLIGFPGQFYYEFDLSGKWRATTTASPVPKLLDAQTVTFASEPGITIGISDNETGGVRNDYDNTAYTFKASYMNMEMAAGTDSYTCSADGSSYGKVPAAGNAPEVTVSPVEVYAFRPYFNAAAKSGNVRTRSIIFSNETSQLKGKDDDGPGKDEIGGTLDIYAKRHKIVVESSLAYTVDVRIVNTAGITLNSFTIEPGETVVTRVNTSGVYIVQPSEVKYTKKLAVR